MQGKKRPDFEDMRYIIGNFCMRRGDLSCRLVHDQPKLHQGTQQLRNPPLALRKQARFIKQTKHVHMLSNKVRQISKIKTSWPFGFLLSTTLTMIEQVLNPRPQKVPRLYQKQKRFESISNRTKIPTTKSGVSPTDPAPAPSLALNARTALAAMKPEVVRLVQAQSLLRFTGADNATLGRGLKKLRIDHCCIRRHEFERQQTLLRRGAPCGRPQSDPEMMSSLKIGPPFFRTSLKVHRCRLRKSGGSSRARASEESQASSLSDIGLHQVRKRRLHQAENGRETYTVYWWRPTGQHSLWRQARTWCCGEGWRGESLKRP